MTMSQRIIHSIFLTAFLCLSGCAVTRSQVRKVALPEDMPARVAFVSPLPGARIISNFGPRDNQFHQGIDLKKSEHGGDPVLAARDGVIEVAKRYFGYGRMVVIRHKDGSSTRYAHLSKILVEEGHMVAIGEQIGTVGSSGNATTPHLHFEIITRSDCPIDPRPYILK